MAVSEKTEEKFNTRLLHGKTSTGYGQREILPSISQVTAFRYESMEELENVFQHKRMGYAYTRIGNPTLTAFEQKLSELEGGAGAVCCSSGMSAISTALLAVCESGDEIIAGSGLYGGTIDLFHDLGFRIFKSFDSFPGQFQGRSFLLSRNTGRSLRNYSPGTYALAK